MSLPIYDQNEIKKEMWENYLFQTPMSSTYCTWCYDKSDTTCKCAERRFYNRLSDKRIKDYMDGRMKMDLEYIRDQIDIKKDEIKELETMLQKFEKQA